ncbi:MAG: 5-formyltetrahydrofolate cyclo-ligase, partial [Anaerovorax sp.]
MGIWEPNLHKRGLPKPSLINPAEIDLVILPGVAFDLEGNRLGYGKGCYDRFLPKLKPQAKKIALAYEFQIVKAIPIQPFDVKIDGFL